MLNSVETRELHRALIAREPDASRRLIDICNTPLWALLRRKYGYLPREVLEDAAIDALLWLIQKPEKYHPGQGSLLNLLFAVADHKVVDTLRVLQRRKEIAVGGSVELALVEAKQPWNENTANYREGDSDMLPPDIERLLAEILPDSRDRAIWELVCYGRGETAEYAAALGLEDLPVERQKQEIKRHRDRVIKRIQRRREEFRRLLG